MKRGDFTITYRKYFVAIIYKGIVLGKAMPMANGTELGPKDGREIGEMGEAIIQSVMAAKGDPGLDAFIKAVDGECRLRLGLVARRFNLFMNKIKPEDWTAFWEEGWGREVRNAAYGSECATGVEARRAARALKAN